MNDIRNFLRQIQAEAAAGDPAVVGTVRIFVDLLEELGDARADAVRALSIWKQFGRRNGSERNQTYWLVGTSKNGFSCYDGTAHSPYADALRELARRVMEAMTKPCPYCSIVIRVLGDGCGRCDGDGWLLTEAEACKSCGGYGELEFVHNGKSRGRVPLGGCPDCDGKGWRVKETAHITHP